MNHKQTYTVVNGVSYLTEEEWYENDKYHRNSGPAYQRWIVCNTERHLTEERWYENGKYHRVDNGPASQQWKIINGERYLTRYCWYQYGNIHRDGFLPAYKSHYYCKGGRIYTLEELQQAGRVINCFMKILKAKIKRKKIHVMKALRNVGCTVFPGLEGLIFQY